MERTDILARLKDVISSSSGADKDSVDRAGEGSDLKTDLNLDSIGMLYLVISLEEAFGVNFDDVSFNDFEKVKDVVDCIESKLG